MNDADFIRYLAAKKSIDDRALNAHVRDTFLRELAREPDLRRREQCRRAWRRWKRGWTLTHGSTGGSCTP